MMVSLYVWWQDSRRQQLPFSWACLKSISFEGPFLSQSPRCGSQMSLSLGPITSLWTDLSFPMQRIKTWNPEQFICYFQNRSSRAFFYSSACPSYYGCISGYPKIEWYKTTPILTNSVGQEFGQGLEEGLSLLCKDWASAGKTWKLGWDELKEHSSPGMVDAGYWTGPFARQLAACPHMFSPSGLSFLIAWWQGPEGERPEPVGQKEVVRTCDPAWAVMQCLFHHILGDHQGWQVHREGK